MTDLMLVAGLLAVTIVMFAVNRPRMDAVALIMLTILPFTGVITMDEALAGFSDPNIVLIAALFVIGDGLVRTGVAARLGDLLIAKAGGKPGRLVVLVMLAVGVLGTTMSSTGVVAIFIPSCCVSRRASAWRRRSSGVLRCIDLDGAYRAVHWKTLVLIVGILPFALALERTGGVELVDAVRSLTAGAGTHVLLGSLFLITFVLGLFISNTATAVLMAPVAIGMAAELDASPYPFAMIVALAASGSYMTPVSSPVNTMVAASANYGFGDFMRDGGPLSVIVLLVSVVLVPWSLPLR